MAKTLDYLNGTTFAINKCIKDGDLVTGENLNKGQIHIYDEMITFDDRINGLEVWSSDQNSALPATYVKRDGSGGMTGNLNMNGYSIYFGSDDYLTYNDSTNTYTFVSDGSSNNTTITAAVFNGTATAARYADLAEKYETDREYPVGTVLEVQGEKEVTLYKGGALAGVISENPGLMINAEGEGQYVALKGKVPVICEGDVYKGQYCLAIAGGKVQGKFKEEMTALDVLNIVGVALEDSKNKMVQVKI